MESNMTTPRVLDGELIVFRPLFHQMLLNFVNHKRLWDIHSAYLIFEDLEPSWRCGMDKPNECTLEHSRKQVTAYLSQHSKPNIHTEVLAHNIDIFCHAFGIEGQAAKQLITYAVLDEVLPESECFFNSYFHLVEHQRYKDIIAWSLGLNTAELEEEYLKLSQLGLFRPWSKYQELGSVSLPIEVVSALVHEKITDITAVLKGMLHPEPSSRLAMRHFPDALVSDMRLFLNKASISRLPGINVLLHGAPGVGKTELARLLVEHCQSRLLAVKAKTFSTRRGDKSDALDTGINSGAMRLQYLKLVSTLVANSDSTLLIDECEDVFLHNHAQALPKELLHNILESNPIPCIWITNHISVIQESILRRFTFVYQIPELSQAAQLELVDEAFKGLRVSKSFKTEFSKTHNLSPASITQIGDVASRLTYKNKDAERFITDLADEYAIALDKQVTNNTYRTEIPFDINMVNIKGEGENNTLRNIQQNMQHQPDVRVLLFGPPGTGKTSFVHHLAESTDCELKHVRCSDILDKYVGESEQKVKRLFRDASQEQAIILLDEVDSLLMSRSRLNATHEVQLVNEFLTQIECYRYPLFAATNYHERLDSAVLRRFDYKLTLDYLTSRQVIILFLTVTKLKRLSNEDKHTLMHLTRLTPGDFAIVERRRRMLGKSFTVTQAIKLLVEENNRKATSTPIGFIQ